MSAWNKILNYIILLLKKLTVKDQLSTIPFFSKDFANGKNVSFGDFTYGSPVIFSWDESTKLKVGKFCSIAAEVKIYLGGNHRIDWVTTYPFSYLNTYFPRFSNIKGHPSSKGDVIIGNDVWLGGSCVILSGVTIGDGAVIGANAVVTKNIGPYEVYAGNPARFIKKRFSDAEIMKLLEMKWWNWDLDHINSCNQLLCSGRIDELYKYYCTTLRNFYKH
jgi:acetyltransferase-like isoleucine patch superfamily enzyme